MLGPWYLYRPAMAVRSVARRLSRRPREPMVEVRTAFGCRIRIDRSEAIGRALALNEIYEIGVSEMLARAASGGATTLVDVGANIGYMSLLMAAFAGPGAKVWAFEPHPGIHERLRENVQLNRYGGRIVPSPIAISDSPGGRPLYLPAGFQSNHGLGSLERAGETHIDVVTDTLDNLFAGTGIDVLKIDVEGHELSVLRGAERLLSSGRIGVIVFEAHGQLFDSVEAYLRSKGLSIWAIDHDLWRMRLTRDIRHGGSRFEAPNFLAMKEEDEKRLRAPPFGWTCLKRP